MSPTKTPAFECRTPGEDTPKEKRVEIRTPKGVQDGWQLRVGGVVPPPDGKHTWGDLYVRIKVSDQVVVL